MVYHDILGIPENAPTTEIEKAYKQKVEVLEAQSTCLTQQQHDKKAQELLMAKESCLLWHDKSFYSKTAEKIHKYASDMYAPNRASIYCCIGPCTCMDGCTCNSAEDSCLVSYCGMETPCIAYLCDLLLYGFFGLIAYADYRKDQDKKEEQLSRERHAKMIEDTKKEIEALRKTLSDIDNKIDRLSGSSSEVEQDLVYFKQVKTFFIAIGAALALGDAEDLLTKRNEAARIELEKATAEKRRIEQRIESLSHRLN